MSRSITELSKNELLNILYNKFDVLTYNVCFCVSCEQSPKYTYDLEIGYICDDCEKRMING